MILISWEKNSIKVVLEKARTGLKEYYRVTDCSSKEERSMAFMDYMEARRYFDDTVKNYEDKNDNRKALFVV